MRKIEAIQRLIKEGSKERRGKILPKLLKHDRKQQRYEIYKLLTKIVNKHYDAVIFLLNK